MQDIAWGALVQATYAQAACDGAGQMDGLVLVTLIEWVAREQLRAAPIKEAANIADVAA